MIRIYMDESGDLGFDLSRKGTSRFFVITFLISENKRALDKVVKNVFARMSKTSLKHRKNGVLHAYYEDKTTKLRLLGLLAKTDSRIITIRLDKQKVFLPVETTALYNHITNTLLNKCLENRILSLEDEIVFIASKLYTAKRLNLGFENSLLKDNSLKIKVEIKAPHAEKGLQAVDFASWSLYQKYERGKSEYADVVAAQTVGEYELYE
jgi:hypothetical protein